MQRALVLLLVACVCVLATSRPASARDLIINGAFTAGANDQPTGWRPDLWSAAAGTTFEWKKGDTDPGVVIVRSPNPNDARWIQEVQVQPGQWYRLSGFVRAVGVSTAGVGASISLLRGFDRTESFHGDTEWTPVSMWFKANPDETKVTVACRLGGYAETSSGEAWCTGIRLEAQAAPPLNANFVYGPLEEASTPVGLPTVLGLVFLLAFGIGHHGRLPATVPRREKLALAGILVAVLAVKIVLAPYFQYRVDVGTYSAWAIKLAGEGPARFYAPGYFADYPPGYMYVLWGIGRLSSALGIPFGSAGFLILLKLPALLADAAVAWLLFARLRGDEKRLAWTAALAYALNPALVVNSAVWGQTDSVLGLLVLLAFLAQGERRFELAWVFAALAVLTKPQALLLVPLLAFWPRGWWRTGRPLSSALAAAATVFIVADPFRGERPWRWLVDLYFGTTGYYAETSVNAMNLAALLFGMRHNDAEITLGLSANNWGFLIGLTLGLAFFVAYLRRRDRVLYTNLFAAATLVAFACLTRMHERYLYPYFVFAGLLAVTGPLGAVYWVLSALFLTNQLVVYLYQESATAGPEWLWRTVAVLNTGCVLAWLALTWRIVQGKLEVPGARALQRDDSGWLRWLAMERTGPSLAPVGAAGSAEASPDGSLRSWTRYEIAYLLALLALSLGLRLYEIDKPPEVVFDEIYFVEQGRNYLSGTDFLDPHPPFAKLVIGLGIGVFGDTPFGWRFMNAVVGTVLVGLMYLLARELFQRRLAAGFAAFFVAVDGLCLVDSRIAVIDIHYVTWAIAAYVLTIRLIRRRDYQNVPFLLAIGAVLGLSVGSKLYIPFFSFLLVLGAIAVTGWLHARATEQSPVRYLAKPILVVGWSAFGVYLLTYTPHFLWGWWHSPIDLVNYIFVEVPNYQAAVADAKHPYSSKWWTWPLLLRPVWYFWKDPGPAPGTVVGIWGSGNLALWWAALGSLFFVAWHAVRERRMALAFVAAGWLIHLMPWVGIGRTLFLYHYLPSLLFAFLALAWLLDRLWSGEGTKVERGMMGAVVLGSLFPVVWYTLREWAIPFIAILILFEGLTYSPYVEPKRLGRVVVAGYCVAIVAISWYFLPIWLGLPMAKNDWQSRMWFSDLNYQFLNWI